MATPLVAGAAALVRQYFIEVGGTRPPPLVCSFAIGCGVAAGLLRLDRRLATYAHFVARRGGPSLAYLLLHCACVLLQPSRPVGCRRRRWSRRCWSTAARPFTARFVTPASTAMSSANRGWLMNCYVVAMHVCVQVQAGEYNTSRVPVSFPPSNLQGPFLSFESCVLLSAFCLADYHWLLHMPCRVWSHSAGPRSALPERQCQPCGMSIYLVCWFNGFMLCCFAAAGWLHRSRSRPVRSRRRDHDKVRTTLLSLNWDWLLTIVALLQGSSVDARDRHVLLPSKLYGPSFLRFRMAASSS